MHLKMLLMAVAAFSANTALTTAQTDPVKAKSVEYAIQQAQTLKSPAYYNPATTRTMLQVPSLFDTGQQFGTTIAKSLINEDVGGSVLSATKDLGNIGVYGAATTVGGVVTPMPSALSFIDTILPGDIQARWNDDVKVANCDGGTLVTTAKVGGYDMKAATANLKAFC